MTDREIIQHPTKWGFMDEAGIFRVLPKAPLVLGAYTPPCDVTLPDGRVRHVIEQPPEE